MDKNIIKLSSVLDALARARRARLNLRSVVAGQTNRCTQTSRIEDPYYHLLPRVSHREHSSYSRKCWTHNAPLIESASSGGLAEQLLKGNTRTCRCSARNMSTVSCHLSSRSATPPPAPAPLPVCLSNRSSPLPSLQLLETPAALHPKSFHPP